MNKLIFIALFSILLTVSCNDIKVNEEFKHQFEKGIWNDRFGNEYSFQNGKILSNNLFSNDLEELGNYQLNKEGLILDFQEHSDTFSLEKFNENSIILKRRTKEIQDTGLLWFHFSNVPLVNEKFEIHRKNILIDTEEHLSYFAFEIQTLSFYSGIRYFELTKNKLYRTDTNDNFQKLPDSVFVKIEQYLRILNLEIYKDNYQFPITDGVNFMFEIKTNKVARKIISKGGVPDGLDNLVAYIRYCLEIQMNTAANKQDYERSARPSD